MGHAPMLPASLNSLVRRGGILQGPRLIAAILVVCYLYYFFSSPAPPRSDLSPRPIAGAGSGPAHIQHGGKDVVQEIKEKQKEKEQESLSNKFFEYMGSHKAKPPPATPSSTAENEGKTWSTAGNTPNAAGDPTCDILAKGANDLVVVLRTAASDLYSQLPSRVLTNLRCANLAIFSTVEHSIGSYQIHDALANIGSKVRDKHREFELYAKLQSAQRAYQDFSKIKENEDNNLDKWTLIPSLVAAYNMNPDKKWFVYLDGDTYLSLPNALSWLGQLDPTVPFYAGSEVMLGDVELGSSSAGIVLSNAAVGALAARYKTRKSTWEEMTGDRCCGDQVLSEVLKELNITLHRSFPNIQGETPLGLEWSPRHWCKAAVTWHKMSPALMDMLWQFERNWTIANAEAATTSHSKRAVLEPEEESAASNETHKAKAHDFSASIGIPPILYKDYFNGFLVPLIRASQNRSDWDNFSNSLTYTDGSRTSSYAHSSPDTCRAACDIRAKCVQYVHEPNKCRLGTTVRFGEAVEMSKHMKSGWLVHRVEKFGQQFDDECVAADAFAMPDPENPQQLFVPPEDEESWKPNLEEDEEKKPEEEQAEEKEGAQKKVTSNEGSSEPSGAASEEEKKDFSPLELAFGDKQGRKPEEVTQSEEGRPEA